MKDLPTVVASAGRDLAIEIVAFQGVDHIPNRDAVGFSYQVRLEPGGPISRLAVLFSGTVLAVRPEAFGLPVVEDRDTAFRTFAEAAIGDYLDDVGLPPLTTGGVAAAKVECFSPHFQTWRDRTPASDEVIERYLSVHAFHAWKYDHGNWVLGPSDLLRLNQPLNRVMKLVHLHAGEAWEVSAPISSGTPLKPTREFVRQNRMPPRQAPQPDEQNGTATDQPGEAPAVYVYVDETRIGELKRLVSPKFDPRKLIALCEELNHSYRAQCYHAVAALTRAVIDHVPPAFGCRMFSEVANNAAGSRSFKECMRRLDESARKIADDHLHTQIRSRESLPTRVQVNFSNEVDMLLAELIRRLGDHEAGPST